jgi:uncharacterized protein
MLAPKIVVSLPVADRARAHAFWGAGGLGLETPGEPAEDGVPEPLVVVLNDGLDLMLVPTGGFGWTVPDHEVAGPGTVECQLAVARETPADVDALADRVVAAGGTVVTAAAEQPWGYAATLADPDGHLLMVLVPA